MSSILQFDEHHRFVGYELPMHVETRLSDILDEMDLDETDEIREATDTGEYDYLVLLPSPLLPVAWQVAEDRLAEDADVPWPEYLEKDVTCDVDLIDILVEWNLYMTGMHVHMPTLSEATIQRMKAGLANGPEHDAILGMIMVCETNWIAVYGQVPSRLRTFYRLLENQEHFGAGYWWDRIYTIQKEQ